MVALIGATERCSFDLRRLPTISFLLVEIIIPAGLLRFIIFSSDFCYDFSENVHNTPPIGISQR
jgi:hypothetical protein